MAVLAYEYHLIRLRARRKVAADLAVWSNEKGAKSQMLVNAGEWPRARSEGAQVSRPYKRVVME